MSFEGGGSSRHQMRRTSTSSIDYNTNSPEYLSWRRLHLSKSKLSGVAEMASFMAGFSVVATVELQINDDGSDPVLLTAFVVTTSILVATSMMVIMISTCILPQLEAVTKMSKCPSDEVLRSPHDSLIRFIDLSWILANTVSLFLFTLDVILVCWIKFTHFSYEASVCATAIMAPVLVIILIFGIIFYRKIIKHQFDIFSKKCLELEEMQTTLQLRLDDMTRTGSPSGSEQGATRFGGLTMADIHSMSASAKFHGIAHERVAMEFSDVASSSGDLSPSPDRISQSPGGEELTKESSDKTKPTYIVYDV